MGHLYHGYDSHNQRIWFKLAAILFQCLFQPPTFDLQSTWPQQMTRLRITTQWTHCEPGVDMIWIIHESRQINGGIQAASPTRHCWLLHNVANSWQSGLLKEVALDPPGGHHIPLRTLGDGLTHTVKPQFLWKSPSNLRCQMISIDINTLSTHYQHIINTSYFGGWHLGLAPVSNFNGSSAFKCSDPFPKPVRPSASLTPLHPLHPLPLVSSGFLHQVPLATEPRNSAPGKFGESQTAKVYAIHWFAGLFDAAFQAISCTCELMYCRD